MVTSPWLSLIEKRWVNTFYVLWPDHDVFPRRSTGVRQYFHGNGSTVFSEKIAIWAFDVTKERFVHTVRRVRPRYAHQMIRTIFCITAFRGPFRVPTFSTPLDFSMKEAKNLGKRVAILIYWAYLKWKKILDKNTILANILCSCKSFLFSKVLLLPTKSVTNFLRCSIMQENCNFWQNDIFELKEFSLQYIAGLGFQFGKVGNTGHNKLFWQCLPTFEKEQS